MIAKSILGPVVYPPEPSLAELFVRLANGSGAVRLHILYVSRHPRMLDAGHRLSRFRCGLLFPWGSC